MRSANLSLIKKGGIEAKSRERDESNKVVYISPLVQIFWGKEYADNMKFKSRLHFLNEVILLKFE